MINPKWEGKNTEPFDIYISRELIKDYSQLIGDYNPIFHDTKSAISKGYPDIIAPLTFPIIFWQHATILWLKRHTPLIHRDQTFFYKQPITAGQTYTCQIQLKKIIVKNNIQYLKHELFGSSTESIIDAPSFRANSTLIIK